MNEPLENSFADLAAKRAGTTPSVAGVVPAREGLFEAVPLGKNADFAPTVDLQQFTIPAPGTVKAWYLRSFGREILKRAGIQKRLRFCGVKVTPKCSGVGVYARPDRSYGRFSGVCVCGQSLVCPVCAPRIAAFRAVDVAKAFTFCVSQGFEPRLITYTLPHSREDNLGDLLDMLGNAWRVYGKGRMADFRRKNKVGAITAAEINWGEANGWHPHKHQAAFFLPGTFDEELQRAGWLAALETIGRRTAGTESHAYRAGEIGSEAGAAYISKLGLSVSAEAHATGVSMELAGGANKGRNIIQLLAAAAGGDEAAAFVWMSGVSEVIARKVTSLRWDRGFRELCGVPLEKPEEQIAAEEVLETDIYLGELNFHQWKIIVNHRAELALCIAANQGLDYVNRLLLGLGAGVLDMERSGPIETTPAQDRATLAEVMKAAVTDGKISSAWRGCAEIQREIDRPAGLTRSHIAGLKG
jgi:hypothetical protein